MGPVVIINDVFQTSKKPDPCPWHPHYMRLHRWWKVLNLYHRDCASERSKVPLNSPEDSLGLSCWEVPYYCCSPSGGIRGFRSWVMPISCIVGRSHGSHICMQQMFTCQILWHTKNDIYNKNDIKMTYANKKKQTTKVETFPSLLAPH